MIDRLSRFASLMVAEGVWTLPCLYPLTMRTRDVRDRVRDTATDVLIKAIRYLNRTKDRTLSVALHNVADQYDTRPTGEWSWIKRP